MRVALVGPYPRDATQSPGGVQTSFANLLSGLAELGGLEPTVLTFVPGLEVEERAAVGRVPVRYLPTPRRFSNPTVHARERRTLTAALADLRPEIVHAQDAQQYGFVCLRARSRVPVVVSIHGIVREERRYVARRTARLRTSIAGVAMERYCVRRARYLVAPTHYAERVFAGEIRGRIWEIPNPIADRFFALEPAPEPGRILFTGALIPRKRLLDLVEAMPAVLRAAPQARLRVTGGVSDEAYGDAVRSRVRELGLEEVVTFLGGVTFGELLDEYRRAWVLALPSGEETSPMVIAEAMAVGMPVVATRVGGVASLVGEGVTGDLVDVGDVDALAACLTRVIGDPDLRAAFGAAGRGRAEERFRVEAVARRFAEMYEQIRATAERRRSYS
ncbi:MAG: glycosyltransferase family 4 protein [Actinomycetota bacterium]|nr:glycosyltransferase family 4 protein [Actinomycetota bacterium]